MTTEIDDKVRRALREWTDALLVAVPTAAVTTNVVPLRRAPRRWPLAAVTIAACAVVIVGVWVVRDRDHGQLQSGGSTATTPTITTPVGSAPAGAGLFLSQTQFRAGTVTEVMLVQTETTSTAGSGARLQAWSGSGWTTSYGLPVARMGERAAPAVPGDAMAHDDVGIQPQLVLHVQLPALDPGTYRVALTDAATAVFDVCADCTPAAGPPVFDFVDRVDPAVITDDTTAVQLFDTDTGAGPLESTGLLVERWVDGTWRADYDIEGDVLTAILDLPNGTYRLWETDHAVAGFFIEHAVDVQSFIVRGVNQCATQDPLPTGWYRLPSGEACSLGDSLEANVFLADAAVAETDGRWTVTVSLRPGTLYEWNALTAACFSHDKGCSTGQLVFILDDRVVSVATVQTPEFSGSVMIAGDFDEATANTIANSINAEAATVDNASTDVTEHPAATGG